MLRVLKQAAKISPREHHEAGRQSEDFDDPYCCQGIKVNTSPTNFHPIQGRCN